MKRLLSLLICTMLNVSIMCGNFGTTHFIVGYRGKIVPKKELKKHRLARKQSMLLDGTSLIDKNRVSQSFFTTIHDLSSILSELISQTNKRLYIAAFILTDSRIVDAITQACQRGVDVRIITDASNMRGTHSKIQDLVEQNVSVSYYKPSLHPEYKKKGLTDPLMHHKLMIGDDFVVTGSANLTKAGLTKAGKTANMENITILRDKETIKEYLAEFERLIKFCNKCMPETRA